MGKTTRTYKTPVGAIPKIVNDIEFKTLNQKIFYDIIGEEQTQLVLCHGIAGTGKTYISVYKALQDVLRRGTGYDKLIIINPTVDVGNEDKLGYLPGELDKKIQQYNESTFTILDKIIGKARAGKMIQDGKIEIGVLNFLRGTNLENCYVILDEAQNVSPMQIKTIMTRISHDCKMIIQGDLSQCDKYKANGITAYEKSGFYDDELRKVVQVNADRGVDFIKTRGTERAGLPQTDPRKQTYTESQLKIIVEEARKFNIPVMAHAHGDEGGYAAVKAGVKSIEHGTYLTERTLKLMKL